jgi:hypothetical protein
LNALALVAKFCHLFPLAAPGAERGDRLKSKLEGEKKHCNDRTYWNDSSGFNRWETSRSSCDNCNVLLELSTLKAEDRSARLPAMSEMLSAMLSK